MEENIFLLSIPNFIPSYKEDTCYGYSKYKENLLDLLKETSGGYCMYCYNRVYINGDYMCQIEHGIEKSNSTRLEDCVPNLGIACPKCNQSYKKTGEKKRKLKKESITAFEKGTCLTFNCKVQCNNFIALRKEYVKYANIILQPFGVVNDETKHEYRLQYDVLKGKYLPSEEETYTSNERRFIEAHIKQFGLNNPKSRNREIGRYCRNVIDQNSILDEVEYNNLLVDLFRDKLRKKDINTAVHICEVVYKHALINLQT